MTPSNKLKWCILGNFIVLVLVITLTSVFESNSPYWRVGWQDDLIVVSVKIDTMVKYMVLLLIIALINISKVVVEEIGMPILFFTVYNPDNDKVIVGFKKMELQIYANLMFTISGLRGIFMTMVTISQIDIAIFSLLIAEFASIFTIRMLLNEKKFDETRDIEDASLDLAKDDVDLIQIV